MPTWSAARIFIGQLNHLGDSMTRTARFSALVLLSIHSTDCAHDHKAPQMKKPLRPHAVGSLLWSAAAQIESKVPRVQRVLYRHPPDIYGEKSPPPLTTA
jgi:hypothetical protein